MADHEDSMLVLLDQGQNNRTIRIKDASKTPKSAKGSVHLGHCWCWSAVKGLSEEEKHEDLAGEASVAVINM